jgi:AraC-like DNA-binding protein
MSRSAFAPRFAQLVEEPPLTHLTRLRMQKASRLLEASSRRRCRGREAGRLRRGGRVLQSVQALDRRGAGGVSAQGGVAE